MTTPGDTARRILPEIKGDRLAVLSDVIDWAEREAVALNAVEAGICLQLARLALQTRRSQP